jgi:hypothetical protein
MHTYRDILQDMSIILRGGFSLSLKFKLFPFILHSLKNTIMKKHLFATILFLLICGLSSAQYRKPLSAGKPSNFANTALSNLTSTSINKSLVPNANNTLSLGNGIAGWKDLYLNGTVYLGSDAFLSGPIDNTFTGRGAGLNNTGDGNTAYGFQAMYSSNTGAYNTAMGYGSLVNNTNGGSNTSVGFQTLYANNAGYGNTAIGRLALGNSTDKDLNTGLGYAASDVANGYSYATFLGALATTADDLFNVTAVGFAAQTTASNTVTLGNTSVTEVNSSGTFVTTSDGRFKSDIKQEVPGLELIININPVTYY